MEINNYDSIKEPVNIAPVFCTERLELKDGSIKDQVYIPYTRTITIPFELTKLSKEWLAKAREGMKPGDKRYFITDPRDPTQGILLGEMRFPDFSDYALYVQRHRDCPTEIVYSTLGLTEEAGEVAGKLKKYWRDKVYLDPESYSLDDIPRETREAVMKELGDVLWYINDLARGLGYNLLRVATMNMDKLDKRLENGTIHGEGDNR